MKGKLDKEHYSRMQVQFQRDNLITSIQKWVRQSMQAPSKPGPDNLIDFLEDQQGNWHQKVEN